MKNINYSKTLDLIMFQSYVDDKLSRLNSIHFFLNKPQSFNW